MKTKEIVPTAKYKELEARQNMKQSVLFCLFILLGVLAII